MTRAKDSTLTKLVIQKGKAQNNQKSILEVDYMTNHYLELADDKQDMIRQTIKDINKSVNKRKIKNKEYLSSVNDYFKGKLFYIAYKEGKYLKIADVEKVIDKVTLIEFINEIETGQEFALELIDNIANQKLKDFFYGIFTYLYF